MQHSRPPQHRKPRPGRPVLYPYPAPGSPLSLRPTALDHSLVLRLLSLAALFLVSPKETPSPPYSTISRRLDPSHHPHLHANQLPPESFTQIPQSHPPNCPTTCRINFSSCRGASECQKPTEECDCHTPRPRPARRPWSLLPSFNDREGRSPCGPAEFILIFHYSSPTSRVPYISVSMNTHPEISTGHREFQNIPWTSSRSL